MRDIDKFKGLIALLDSYRFGAYSTESINKILDNFLTEAEGIYLECLLEIKFKGISSDPEENILIAKKYLEKGIKKRP